MTQRAKLLKLVQRNGGLTATGYARLMGFSAGRDIVKDANTYYKPASLLRELHRFANDGVIHRVQGIGMTHGSAWRFYPRAEDLQRV